MSKSEADLQMPLGINMGTQNSNLWYLGLIAKLKLW